MKKLFTTLAAVSCVLAGTAQTLTFSHNGVPIENGATFCSGDLNEGMKPLWWFDPKISLSSDVDGHVYASIRTTDGTGPQICFLGTCTAASATNNFYVEKKAEMKANETVDTQIDWNAGFVEGTYTSRTEVSAWYEGKESEKVSFTLIMTNDEGLLSIPGTEAGAPRITVDAGVLHYSFPEPGTHTLSVYATDGAKVADYALSGQEGAVPLDGLHAGLYVYKTDGGAETSGKFIVK